MAKDELVLLYQIDPSSEKGQKVREILSRLNIRVKTISPAMLHQKIGHLAGLPGHSEVDLIYEGDHIPDEVMLMKDLSDSRIDRILKEFREGSVNPSLFESEAEKNLHDAYVSIREAVVRRIDAGDYEAALVGLARLRAPVDDFFNAVLVMASDVTAHTTGMGFNLDAIVPSH